MRLHEHKKLFADAIRATAEFKGIREVYIEKDYWVTLALKTIFSHPDCGDAIFKGGTALSKCYNMVQRFSEDIDLVVVRNEGDSNTKMAAKIKAITTAVDKVLPEIEVKELTRKMGRNRKTVHSYAHEVSGEYGQVRNVVVVEATWMSSSEPNIEQTISSYIYEMMVAKDQHKLATEYELVPIQVRVLAIERTLCEKIMSLVRFSYDDDPIRALQNKIRHCYDLHLMLQSEEVIGFLQSSKFEALLVTVAREDVISFRAGETWLAMHPVKALIFAELDEVWEKLRSTYQEEFSAMVYGELPDHGAIKSSIELIKERLVRVEWSIALEDDG